MEELYRKHNVRKLKKTKNEFKPRLRAYIDKKGNILENKQQILDQWADHFEEFRWITGWTILKLTFGAICERP